MRKNSTLIELEDIIVIYQYLYMSENHFITIDNGMAKLEIRMNEKGYFHTKNLNFPDLPDLNYTEMMNVPNILGIIEQLKETTPVDFPNDFHNRWEEIKSITSANVSQNKMVLEMKGLR